MAGQIIPINDIASAGVVVDMPAVSLAENIFTDCLNVRFRDGAVRKMEGEEAITTPFTDSILYVAFWNNPNLGAGTGYYIVVTNNGSVDKITAIKNDGNQTIKVLKDNIPQGGVWQHTLFNGGFSFIINNGIHAEPTTMGLTFARFYAEMDRNRTRLIAARAEIATGAISGAVGTFANIDPAVEEHVCAKLGLTAEPISTQVIPRDRHAAFFATLGVVGSSIENIATEIRHMQRTEVLEAEEFFSKGQKGSSAMPHKRNPVLTENLTGLARLIRMAVVPAMENVTLWHERDISHSSVERNIGPDTTITLDFALSRLTQVIEKLVIYPDNMLANMNKFRGLVMSQRVLLALTQAGVSREDAYRLVQRNAMKVWEQGKDFKTELLGDEDVLAALSTEQITEKFDLNYHTKHVDTIFTRVFGDG